MGTLYVAPGSPWENGYAESFHLKLRDELLATEVFDFLRDDFLAIDIEIRGVSMQRRREGLGGGPKKVIIQVPTGDARGGDSLSTALYYDPIFLEHETGDHPERAARMLPTARYLTKAGLDLPMTRPPWAPATRERLGRVHAVKHIDAIRDFAARGGGYLEPDTVVSSRSYEVAISATGAVCAAVERVVVGDDRRAFCLIRPPGHHATQDRAQGFCLFNHLAVAARVATEELSIDRALIVDWDVHHGNGTQATFWEDGRVAFLSIHRYPFYPGTGAADETGSGKGLGWTLNLPMKFGTAPDEILSRFRGELERFAAKAKPDLVLVSAGFDAHRLDPIGSLGLESEDFGALTRAVLDVADDYAGGRVVSVLEGGYDPEALRDSIAVHLEALIG